MKLQNLTVIFIIIMLPIILLTSLYITTGLRTIKYQSIYDSGLLTATHDAIYAFELNTANNEFRDNPEIKRDILKSSIKMFEKSLCNACGISSYNTDEIEEYIPAIVFGMYDGFYMYAPSYNERTGKYEHTLKSYVYYSETIEKAGYGDTDITIRYSLDNYIIVSGIFDEKNVYETRGGYLTTFSDREWRALNIENATANRYHKEAIEFTRWFNNNITNNIYDPNMLEKLDEYLFVSESNNPNDENSAFSKHKNEIIKNKIENLLNSSITAYSEKNLKQNYKMPKFSEEDWKKVYSNISMITFFQGKNIGFTKYNGYCVLNSTNSNEYVNPNLMYFIDESGYYHDIRCEECEAAINDGERVEGYKIGSFKKKKVQETDGEGNTITRYEYENDALACYKCINGSLDYSQSVYEYINDNATDNKIKATYYTALAKERYNTTKLLEIKEDLDEITIDTEGVDIIPALGHTAEDVKNGNFKEGDIVEYGDYEYRYNQYYDADEKDWLSTSGYSVWNNGWSAKVIDTSKTSYDNPVSYIYGLPLKGMSGAFYQCTNLIKTVEVPDTVLDMSIAYQECSSLRKVTSIGENVKNLRGTFWYCTNLKTIECEIPTSVSNMKHTFWCCTNLEGIIEINAINVNNYSGCFGYTTGEIILRGDSEQLEVLAGTGNNGNVNIAE